jgi:hypothetical protein
VARPGPWDASRLVFTKVIGVSRENFILGAGSIAYAAAA